MDVTIPPLTVAVGTYDGVLAGWDYKDQFEISFATPVHGGSIRGLALASNGVLLSCGYDEYLQTHDFKRQLTSSGQIRTPSDMGTPVAAMFGPPYCAKSAFSNDSTTPNVTSSHCIVGFASGQIVIYKKRDWSVQHTLQGHQGGICAMAVHPTGKLALTGGISDGKLKCWDLTKGRLAYASKISPKPSRIPGRVTYESIISLIWNSEGTAYAFAYGSHVTVREVASGKELLDLDLPCRINQLCFLELNEGLFVAVAGNDGSLPVLEVSDGMDSDSSVRRAMMAIEPVEDVVAGDERYKCITSVQPGSPLVVTANSGGVVSLVNLEGAIRMIMTDDHDSDDNEEVPKDEAKPEDDRNDSGADEENPRNNAENLERDDDDSSDSSSEGEAELAADILDSIQLGSGSRITCMVVFCRDNEEKNPEEKIDPVPADENDRFNKTKEKVGSPEQGLKRKRTIALDPEAMDRARALVSKAKKIQTEKDEKRRKKKQKASRS